ncbi:hypothetical protein [Chitinimonas sp.]|uniref:hypothetical protein n=1 Tax=Chitinimonas sp. TaxID=1934313 RepID=UPI002F93AD59
MLEWLLSNWKEFSLSGGAAGLVTWLAVRWVGGRIDSSIKLQYDKFKVDYEAAVKHQYDKLKADYEGSIKYQYDKLKADYEGELRKRERAQLVADLLAEWMAVQPEKPIPMEQRRRINKLSFEAALWLPDEIAIGLGKVLQHDPTADNVFEILLAVRGHLLGVNQLRPHNITYWGWETELENRGLPEGVRHGRLSVSKISIETDGERCDLEMEKISGVHNVSEGAISHLEVVSSHGDGKVGTPSLRAFTLVEKVEDPNAGMVYVVETFPKEIADKINMGIFQRSGLT